MARSGGFSRQAGSVKPDARHRAEIRRIAKELAELAGSGAVLPGTIAERMTRCGRANCACHGDPPRRHGPYWHWTRKVANKTVGRWMDADQAAEYQAWVENAHRIRELVARLEAVGLDTVEADPRWNR